MVIKSDSHIASVESSKSKTNPLGESNMFSLHSANGFQRWFYLTKALKDLFPMVTMYKPLGILIR